MAANNTENVTTLLDEASKIAEKYKVSLDTVIKIYEIRMLDRKNELSKKFNDLIGDIKLILEEISKKKK